LDARLPKLDDVGVLQAVRADPKTRKVRVVILSNYSPRELGKRGQAGVLDHLIKSETIPAKLTAGLERWLTR
jgi:CheY-like chemotaxis protein